MDTMEKFEEYKKQLEETKNYYNQIASFSSEDDMRGILDLIKESVEDMYKNLDKFSNMKDINKNGGKPITQREYTNAKSKITSSIAQLNHLVNNLQIMTQYLR